MQLDQLGNILRLPREGWSDELYRVYLSAQALLIQPGRRTQARLLQVTRALLGPAGPPIIYTEFRPKSYTLGVTGLDLLTFTTWVRFLEFCRPATYNAQITWIPEEPFGFEDATATVPDTVFPFSDATDTIDVGGHWAAIVQIGP